MFNSITHDIIASVTVEPLATNGLWVAASHLHPGIFKLPILFAMEEIRKTWKQTRQLCILNVDPFSCNIYASRRYMQVGPMKLVLVQICTINKNSHESDSSVPPNNYCKQPRQSHNML